MTIDELKALAKLQIEIDEVVSLSLDYLIKTGQKDTVHKMLISAFHANMSARFKAQQQPLKKIDPKIDSYDHQSLISSVFKSDKTLTRKELVSRLMTIYNVGKNKVEMKGGVIHQLMSAGLIRNDDAIYAKANVVSDDSEVKIISKAVDMIKDWGEFELPDTNIFAK